MRRMWMGLLFSLIAVLALSAARPIKAFPPSSAPADATYLTRTTNATLSNELALPIDFVNGSVTMSGSRPLAFPDEEGTPGSGTVHCVRLGGTTDADIFLSCVDGQPGTDETNQGRWLVIFARPATAARPVSGVSAILGGWFHDGAVVHQRSFEMENKIQPDGSAALWDEFIDDTGGHPFMRRYRENESDGVLATHDQPGSTISLAARDTVNQAYRKLLSVTSGQTPALTIAPVAGTAVSITATSYQAADGTAGATVTTCTAFKNGLCVAGF